MTTHGSVATPMTVALVGAGVVAKKHEQAIRYLQKRQLATLSAVVDLNEDAARDLLSGRDIPIYKTLEDCLKASLPDIVAITTPSGTHAALAETALEAGCHVLIEKPMTLSLREADALLQLAEAKERKIAVGHIYRYFPLSLPLKQLIDSGAFGPCLYGDVKVRWGHDQAYYDQAEWRGTYASDGGALLNQSIHAIDLMQWLIGEKALETTAMLARQRHEMEAEDLALGVVRFKNNVYLQIEGTTNTNPKRHEASFTLFFEKGEVRVGLDAGKIAVEIDQYGKRRQKNSYLYETVWQKIREEGFSIIFEFSNPHTFLYLDLVRSIADDRMPLADGQSGRDALATVLSLYRAARERQVVTVRSAIAFPLADMIGVPEARVEEDDTPPEVPAAETKTVDADSDSDQETSDSET